MSTRRPTTPNRSPGSSKPAPPREPDPPPSPPTRRSPEAKPPPSSGGWTAHRPCRAHPRRSPMLIRRPTTPNQSPGWRRLGSPAAPAPTRSPPPTRSPEANSPPSCGDETTSASDGGRDRISPSADLDRHQSPDPDRPARTSASMAQSVKKACQLARAWGCVPRPTWLRGHSASGCASGFGSISTPYTRKCLRLALKYQRPSRRS